MSVQQMREYVIGQYPDSPTWPARVKKMSDNQIIAIYYKMKKRLWRRHRQRRKGPENSSCRSFGAYLPLW